MAMAALGKEIVLCVLCFWLLCGGYNGAGWSFLFWNIHAFVLAFFNAWNGNIFFFFFFTQKNM